MQPLQVGIKKMQSKNQDEIEKLIQQLRAENQKKKMNIDLEDELKKLERCFKDSNPGLYKIYLSQVGIEDKLIWNKYVFEYIAEVTKKTTLWISFNTIYNEIHTFKKDFNSIEYRDYLNPKHTDVMARKEFLNFMQTNFPNTKLVMVFDLVKGCGQYPYLGSLMIDTPQYSEVYNALVEKYGDPYSNDKRVNEALWIMDYEKAVELHVESTKAWEQM